MLESFSNYSPKNEYSVRTGNSNVITGSNKIGSEFAIVQDVGEIKENTTLTLVEKENAVDPFFFQVGKGLAEAYFKDSKQKYYCFTGSTSQIEELFDSIEPEFEEHIIEDEK